MRRRGLPAVLVAVGLVLGGCGSSRPSSPPDLVFTSSRDGDYALYGVEKNGSGEFRLSDAKGDPSTPAGLFFESEPTWSPDGKHIAFTSRRDGVEHVYVMSWDGSGTRRVTSTAKDDSGPSWSPDGKSLIFDREGALFVTNLSGGDARRLAKGPGDAADPAWSPDGSLVAYDYRRPGGPIREIWVIGANGSGKRQLTHLNAVSTSPAWSPDGKRLAFQSDKPGTHIGLYSVGVDGTDVRTEAPSGADTIDPAYAPDGSLSFSRDSSIWLRDSKGAERELTSKGNDSSPAWRPTRAATG